MPHKMETSEEDSKSREEALQKELNAMLRWLFRPVALVLVTVLDLVHKAWSLVRPSFAPVVAIYDTIDLDLLDPLNVLQAFVKFWVMVSVYAWCWVRRAARRVLHALHVLPGCRCLQREVVEAAEQVESDYRFLVRPLEAGLFCRKRC
ncbi:uncharacterized protein LOC143287389 [Babylonia areolata]|uniref:uncharacterized protein LOC143287389 n=1 Tax=Babylonia areolata TaxID=304850 RepID=UPI003FD6A6C1